MIDQGKLEREKTSPLYQNFFGLTFFFFSSFFLLKKPLNLKDKESERTERSAGRCLLRHSN